jgi:multisubunit Na+/H+ antiporter MnhB subunit
MKYGKTAGMVIFVIGIIILVGYGIYQEWRNFNWENFDIVMAIGVAAIIIGLILLFITILIEQQEGKKKMKEEIKKEDLEP